MKSKLQAAGRWALARAKERETWVGLAAIATALGAKALGAQIDQVGTAVVLILGSGLAAASTGGGTK